MFIWAENVKEHYYLFHCKACFHVLDTFYLSCRKAFETKKDKAMQ